MCVSVCVVYMCMRYANLYICYHAYFVFVCLCLYIYIYIYIYIYHCKLTYCSYNDMPFHNIFFRNYFDNIVINV